MRPASRSFSELSIALREYHQAQDRGAPVDEVERLRLLAESLFRAVADYQLRVIAKVRGTQLTKLHSVNVGGQIVRVPVFRDSENESSPPKVSV